MKSSSTEKISINRRTIVRNTSLGRDLIKSNSNSKIGPQKSRSKNTSYELKPIVSHLAVSSSTKKFVNRVIKPTLRKKILAFVATPSNTMIKLPATPVKQKKIEFPTNPKDALLFFSDELNSYEQAEILDYSEIYFIGSKDNKISPKLELNNFGYDDSRGDLKLIKGDHISYRYEILNVLGKGSFGQVCECFDYKRTEKVAIKIIRNKKRFHNQAGIEVTILNALREKDQADQVPVVKMKNYFLFRKHVCISFDLWNINLYELLKGNKFQGLSLSLVKRFAIQILQGLYYTKSLDIIHCDLKPENLLLKYPNKSDLVIIDFGSATFFNERQHTYIQSRFYRAPEIILGIPYTSAIDMWSFGCILAELFTGRPLLPGESEHDQLVLIIELFGNPPPDLLKQGPKEELFFDNYKLKDPMIKNNILKIPGSKSLYEVLNCHDENFLDLLSKCFEWDPSLRITPHSALKHPWLVSSQRKHHSKGNNLSFLDKSASKNKYFF